METTENTEVGTSENDENQTNQSNEQAQETNQPTQPQPAREPGPKTMFLEYTSWKEGQHNISAIIKDPGEKRGKVAARIFTEFSGDPKRPTFTAKDREGNILFPPTQKLWELKKSIKGQAKPLLEKARLAKTTPAVGTPQKKEEPLAKKEFKAMGDKLLSEAGHFADSATEITTGIGRQGEIKSIRNKKKMQKSKGLSR